MTSINGFTWSKESQAVILQGKGWKSLSLKLKSAAWLNNFDDIDTFSMVLLFGLMVLTTDSDSLMSPSSIKSKISTWNRLAFKEPFWTNPLD